MESEQLQRLMTDVVNVRRWRPDPVAEGDLAQLLVAFGAAPSTGQPWELLRLESSSAKQAAVSATLEPLMTPGTEGAQGWLAEAPVVLAVCAEIRRATARLGQAGRLIALQEVGAAIQNLRLMANNLGLRTGVVREFVPDRVREALGLEWFLEPVALVAIGYSEVYLEYPPRYSVAEFSRVHEPPPPAPSGTERPLPAAPAAPSTPGEGGSGVRSAIYRRRSVRRYSGEPLAPGVRERLLEAAIHAPSAGNMQPWEFMVLEGREAREAAVAATYSGYFAGPDNRQIWLLEAPLLIAVGVNRRRTAGWYGDANARWSVLDVAAAIQNLILTATEMGLGSCWIGGFKETEMARTLGVPDGVQVVSLVAVGAAAHAPAQRYRMPLELVTHRDRWGVPLYGPESGRD